MTINESPSLLYIDSRKKLLYTCDMRKTMLVVLILLIASPALALMGSIKIAMFVVDSFYDETLYITRDLKRDESLTKTLSQMRKRKDDTLTALRTMRWIESPGRDRYNKIYRIVETYSDDQIASLNKLKENHDPRSIERMVREMKALKKRKLKEVKGTLKYETYQGKTLPPVPIVDKSPFDSGGKTGTGGEIWFR